MPTKFQTKFLRTCLVTKQKLPKSKLFRFTIQNQTLIFDTDKFIGAGRGAYVEKTAKSLVKLIFLRKKIQHFLKIKNVKILLETIENQKQVI
jgi:predicted RNA-binding protein YlxR (DUF448 family)